VCGGIGSWSGPYELAEGVSVGEVSLCIDMADMLIKKRQTSLDAYSQMWKRIMCFSYVLCGKLLQYCIIRLDDRCSLRPLRIPSRRFVAGYQLSLDIGPF
jgi:hypothetical protein